VEEMMLPTKEREKLLSERIDSVDIEIARGMEYLHSNRVIFRDLKVVYTCAWMSSLLSLGTHESLTAAPAI
jgi:serine/threonine protein kinase